MVTVPQEFRVEQSRAEMAADLEAIQRACFPTLAQDELITAAHYRAQMEAFPEGQLCVLNEQGIPVACSTDLRMNIDFNHYQHRYIDAVGGNWLTTHDPLGQWLYGADIGVHPDYRGKGLGRLLYDARKNLVRRLNLKGHIAGGLMHGYGAMKDKLTPQVYLKKVLGGEIFDPTLSVQLRNGFDAVGIIEDYVDDPNCDGKAVLLVWRNPDYRGT